MFYGECGFIRYVLLFFGGLIREIVIFLIDYFEVNLIEICNLKGLKCIS